MLTARKTILCDRFNIERRIESHMHCMRILQALLFNTCLCVLPSGSRLAAHDGIDIYEITAVGNINARASTRIERHNRIARQLRIMIIEHNVMLIERQKSISSVLRNSS